MGSLRETESQKLTFLLVPVDGVGHVNSFLGVAEHLRDRGHKVVFATPNSWKGKFETQGFLEECYLSGPPEPIQEKSAHKFNDKWGEIVAKMAPSLAMSSVDQLGTLLRPMYDEGLGQMKYAEPRLIEILHTVKPDLIMVDMHLHLPAIANYGVPWTLLLSVNPVGISSKNVPPAFSGYPTDGDRTLWKKFDDTHREVFNDLYEDCKKWVLERGGPELKYNVMFSLVYSPYANLYMYPIELDYTMFRPNPPNWHRFDAFVRSSNDKFEIPKELNNLPGKLVYFSMGTIGSSELGMMRRLIAILGNSPNRFIVSKGPFADQLILPNNMWGASSVPQTKVIPLVDLVITHGGNNTITESFYFGKRVLVLPLFCDQFDNGQRIFETGLGLQFHPCKVTSDELLSAIETLLKDDLLEKRMATISKRIQSSNSQSRAADLVENMAKEYKQKVTSERNN